MKKTRMILLAMMLICTLLAACEDEDLDSDNESANDFLEYKMMAENNRDLPIGVEVNLNNTPNGGVFSVAFFTNDDGVPVPKEDATSVEIHECDENGISIYRTYMNLENNKHAAGNG